MGRPRRGTAEDAMARLFKPSWTAVDPVTKRRVKRESVFWHALYYENGARQRQNLRVVHETDAKVLLAKIIDRLRLRATGHEVEADKPAPVSLARHLRRFLVGLRSERVTPAHLRRRRRCLVECFRAMDATSVAALSA